MLNHSFLSWSDIIAEKYTKKKNKYNSTSGKYIYHKIRSLEDIPHFSQIGIFDFFFFVVIHFFIGSICIDLRVDK